MIYKLTSFFAFVARDHDEFMSFPFFLNDDVVRLYKCHDVMQSLRAINVGEKPTVKFLFKI